MHAHTKGGNTMDGWWLGGFAKRLMNTHFDAAEEDDRMRGRGREELQKRRHANGRTPKFLPMKHRDGHGNIQGRERARLDLVAEQIHVCILMIVLHNINFWRRNFMCTCTEMRYRLGPRLRDSHLLAPSGRGGGGHTT